MPLCEFCFREKTPLQQVYPNIPGKVCKACRYQMERVIGFLRFSGATITPQKEMTLEPETEKETTKDKKK